MKTPSTQTQLAVRIEAELHRELKAAAALQGISLAALIESALKPLVARPQRQQNP